MIDLWRTCYGPLTDLWRTFDGLVTDLCRTCNTPVMNLRRTCDWPATDLLRTCDIWFIRYSSSQFLDLLKYFLFHILASVLWNRTPWLIAICSRKEDKMSKSAHKNQNKSRERSGCGTVKPQYYLIMIKICVCSVYMHALHYIYYKNTLVEFHHCQQKTSTIKVLSQSRLALSSQLGGWLFTEKTTSLTAKVWIL